jgi:hypothetical protein
VVDPTQLETAATADLKRANEFLTDLRAEVRVLREILTDLRKSSNADFGETLVAKVILRLEESISELERKAAKYEEAAACEILRLMRWIESHPCPPSTFSLRLTLYSLPGGNMSSVAAPITSIPLGGQAQLVVQLLFNNAPYVPAAGAPPYTFAPSVASSDPDVASAPATEDVTAGAVPLSQQFLLTDSTNDTVGAIDAVTVNATDPNGNALTETVDFTIGAGVTPPNPFSLSVALYPAPAALAAAAAAAKK